MATFTINIETLESFGRAVYQIQDVLHGQVTILFLLYKGTAVEIQLPKRFLKRFPDFNWLVWKDILSPKLAPMPMCVKLADGDFPPVIELNLVKCRYRFGFHPGANVHTPAYRGTKQCFQNKKKIVMMI